MRMARDYSKLRTFQLADALVPDVYVLTRALPPEERYGLQSQIRRASVSTPTNIVEGSVRRSDRHYLRYLENALGSACEVRYLLGLCVRLELLEERACAPLIERYTEVIRSLSALITRIDEDLRAKRSKRRVAAKTR
jgi:four helix bundle protein